jgi:hypothetical protein
MRQRTEAAIAALAPWLDDPEAGGEAVLRTAYLRFRIGETPEALDGLGRATGATDAFVRYLAHFLIGRLHERQGRRAEAESAYRLALDTLPGAQSGAIALSTVLFLADRPDEAYAVMEAAGRVSPQPPDPWRLYGYGDYRRWPALKAELRRHAAEPAASETRLDRPVRGPR